MALYNSNGAPLIPGAFTTNMGSGAQYYLLVLPIYSSISDLSKMGWSNCDDQYWIVPGYKIEIYNNINYTGLIKTIDNTNGTLVKYEATSSANAASSYKLYYENNEITEKYTYTSVGLTTDAVQENTNSAINGAYLYKNMPIMPGSYLINSNGNGCMPIFWSISNFGSPSTGGYANANDIEDYAIVMPGYCLILYNGNDYLGNKAIVDNTSGTTILVSSAGWGANTRASCELFFNYIKILETAVSQSV